MSAGESGAVTATGSGRSGVLNVLQPFDGEEARLVACIHCGFCLDACPTYTRLGLEPDSPRGRLYLMRAVAEGRVAPDADAFRTHLDRCLGCRACEPVCPSGVQYGHLLERSRAVITRSHPVSTLDRLLLLVFGNRWLSRIASAAGRWLRGTGLAAALSRRLPVSNRRIRFALAMLAASRPWKGASNRVVHRDTSHAGPRRRIAMLTGCVQAGLFGRVNADTAYVLGMNGCEVVDAAGQGCCGALHAHAGQLDSARRLARANIAAFEASGAETIVVNAAGCGAAMKEYGELFEGEPDHERAAAFSRRVVDATELLASLGPRTGAPLSLRAACDMPCHLLHAQRIDGAPLDVLRAIPQLEATTIQRADECCGGAGTYGLAHPELAGRILEDKIAAIRSAAADVVVTGNPGCMMQIGAGLHLAGDATPVLHPVELLAESYRRLDTAAGAGRT